MLQDSPVSRRDWLRCAAALRLLRSPHRAEAGNGELFNGRNFEGWIRAGRGIWSIEQGEIVGRADPERPGPWLPDDPRTIQDFKITLDFWVSGGGNSGIYVREPHRAWGYTGDARPGLGTGSGHEINIDYKDPVNPTGSLYGFKRGGRSRGRRRAMELLRDRMPRPEHSHLDRQPNRADL